ncbi:1-acyl-sn-glycerol-3-phosphate acyltransferase [Arcticibacter pallidicorallinus]|uniref:1-acyl-sn-glycerol-3-phosphate acyltransferase n=1 Tax=Arcticibacter pallidicorallinus TaxID=1259464 RepID=A0A2T0TUH8_9SPHI|nr:lysophospholipid acyltransferase family protein [Arcticibacter pallidicorallinus]PRY49178.1 1-acyl-sn-glycerol-3-phosphate acyltransferase [Arcticibacter pallidicorallinus]
MKRLLGYIFSPIHYLAFLLFLLIFHPIQWLSLKVGGYSAHKRSVDVLNFFLVSTYYLIGCRVSFINPYKLPEGRSIIFVANHQSMFDVPAMIWFLRRYHAKFVSKIELTRGIPSVSFNLKHGGAANIDRKDPKQSISEILKLAKRMRENVWSAAIFPEGTRSGDGVMKTFIPGGATTLIKKVPEVLVVPVAIENSWKITRFGRYPLSFGEHMKITILKPLETEGFSPEEILKDAETAIRNHIV